MSLAALCRRINEFGFELLAKELALDARVHTLETLSRTRSTIMWRREDPSATLMVASPPKVGDYLALLEGGEYSYLLGDGSLIQIAYTFEGDAIERHRLLYHPCPFVLDNELLQIPDVTISDLIREIYLSNVEHELALKAPIRFDFAPSDAGVDHPASHATFNEASCRIPVRAPMRFDGFMQFVLANFYPVALGENGVSDSIIRGDDVECIVEGDRRKMHITWLS